MSWTATTTKKMLPGRGLGATWLLALCLMLGMHGAFAATTASNTATIEPPAGVTDTSGGCDAAVPPNCTGDNISVATINVWAATASKTSSPATGSTVLPGATINYTLSVTVTGVATTAPVVLNDTLGTGLSFGAVGVAGGFTVNSTGNPVVFTLPAGAAVGVHTVTYTAIVAANATGSVGNSVVGTLNCTSAAPCTTNHLVGALTITKTGPVEPAATANGFADPGELLTYTITVTNNSGTAVLPADHYGLTDTLSAGLTYQSSNPPGVNVGATTTWTDLSIGANTSVPFTVTASVNNPITVPRVSNLAKRTGDGDPPCPSAGCPPPIRTATTVTVTKSANPASGSTVLPGQLITYTMTVTVTGGDTTAPVVLSDTLGSGLTYAGLATSPALNNGFTETGSGNTRTFNLPAGQTAGTYRVAYTATVNASATTGTVTNAVTGVPCTPAGSCTTSHSVGSVNIQKLLINESIANDQIAQAGEVLTYRITLSNPTATIVTGYGLTDVLSTGLTYVPNGLATLNGVAPTVAGQTISWANVSLPPGDSTVEVRASVNTPITTAAISNLAKKTGDGELPRHGERQRDDGHRQQFRDRRCLHHRGRLHHRPPGGQGRRAEEADSGKHHHQPHRRAG